MATATGPVREIGAMLPMWANMGPGIDDVPQLTWPQSIDMYSKMRLDPQIHALTQAVTLPIMRKKYAVKANGARDEIVEMIARDLGLPILGEDTDENQQRRRRFSHHNHLRHAILALWYGHMFFNQVGEIVDGKWRLHKLAERMPRTISQIHVADDGGLEGITQHGFQPTTTFRVSSHWSTLRQPPQIKVTELVAYVWEREGANWLGRSMLRPLYRDWALKDRALRVDAIKNERFGAGIPYATSPQGGDPAEYQRMAASIRASEVGGVGLPQGSSIGVAGLTGALPDVLASIRYYDESMARSFLAMFAQLGQTQTGSRALGETFVDFFSLALDGIISWYLDTLNEHVVEDIVDWNWGVEENAPLVVCEPGPIDLPATELLEFINAGVIKVDENVDRWVRQRYNLPERAEGEGAAAPPWSPPSVPPQMDTAAKADSQEAEGDSPPPGTEVKAHLPGSHNQKDHGTGGSHSAYASTADHAQAMTLAETKINGAPVPSAEAVTKARAELQAARAGVGRAGGDSRGGSAKDRRKQRENLFKEFECKDAKGNGKGYVVCPHTALKMHWTDDPDLNPNAYPFFERGKIFTKWQGGGYQLANLLPESFSANRSRNDTVIRSENV